MNEWKEAQKKPLIVQFREVNGEKEEIKTREGLLSAYKGKDFIIRGVKGEIYPISKDIFAETYRVIQEKPQKVVDDWRKNLGKFKERMLHKIRENMAEKGLSWRKMETEELEGLLIIYGQRKKWVSIANIAFMIWENEEKAKC